MNKKHRIWASVVALLYIVNFVLPILLNFDVNKPSPAIFQVFSAIMFIGSPLFFFWLYWQERRIGYLVAAILTLLVLILGIVAVSMVYL